MSSDIPNSKWRKLSDDEVTIIKATMKHVATFRPPRDQRKLTADQRFWNAFHHIHSFPPLHATRFFTWELLGKLLNSGITRAFYVIPLVGYLILFSDQIEKFLNSYMIASPARLLSWRQSALLIYYGSVILLIAYISYLCFCPRAVRRSESRQHYVSNAIASLDANEPAEASFWIKLYLMGLNIDELAEKYSEHPDKIAQLRALREAVNERVNKTTAGPNFSEIVPTILTFYYNAQNYSRSVTRLIIGILVIIGYGMTLVPSAEVFVRVILTSLLKTG